MAHWEQDRNWRSKVPGRFRERWFLEIRKSSSEIDRFSGRFAVADTCNTKGHSVASPWTGKVTIWSCTRCRGRAARSNSLRALKFYRGAWSERTNRRSLSSRRTRLIVSGDPREGVQCFLFFVFVAFLRLPRAQLDLLKTITKSRTLLASCGLDPAANRTISQIRSLRRFNERFTVSTSRVLLFI